MALLGPSTATLLQVIPAAINTPSSPRPPFLLPVNRHWARGGTLSAPVHHQEGCSLTTQKPSPGQVIKSSEGCRTEKRQYVAISWRCPNPGPILSSADTGSKPLCFWSHPACHSALRVSLGDSVSLGLMVSPSDMSGWGRQGVCSGDHPAGLSSPSNLFSTIPGQLQKTCPRFPRLRWPSEGHPLCRPVCAETLQRRLGVGPPQAQEEQTGWANSTAPAEAWWGARQGSICESLEVTGLRRPAGPRAM